LFSEYARDVDQVGRIRGEQKRTPSSELLEHILTHGVLSAKVGGNEKKTELMALR